MPGRDKTGPSGFGPMTGRRMGLCTGNNTSFSSRFGSGFRRGYGFGIRGYYGDEYSGSNLNVSEKTIIENEIRVLKDQLSSLEEQLKKAGSEKNE